jgi:hypothetical protein
MVNLENILNNAQTMGPVFWAGAAAIALGATLLLVSILTMFRRFKLFRPSIKLPGFGKNSRRIIGNKTQAGTASASTVRLTASGYEPTAFPLNNQENPSEAVSTMVSSELTDRLHRAADTLEEIIHGLNKENYSGGFSSLKEDTDGVEYLFKTTVG